VKSKRYPPTPFESLYKAEGGDGEAAREEDDEVATMNYYDEDDTSAKLSACLPANSAGRSSNRIVSY